MSYLIISSVNNCKIHKNNYNENLKFFKKKDVAAIATDAALFAISLFVAAVLLLQLNGVLNAAQLAAIGTTIGTPGALALLGLAVAVVLGDSIALGIRGFLYNKLKAQTQENEDIELEDMENLEAQESLRIEEEGSEIGESSDSSIEVVEEEDSLPVQSPPLLDLRQSQLKVINDAYHFKSNDGQEYDLRSFDTTIFDRLTRQQKGQIYRDFHHFENLNLLNRTEVFEKLKHLFRVELPSQLRAAVSLNLRENQTENIQTIIQTTEILKYCVVLLHQKFGLEFASMFSTQ